MRRMMWGLAAVVVAVLSIAGGVAASSSARPVRLPVGSAVFYASYCAPDAAGCFTIGESSIIGTGASPQPTAVLLTEHGGRFIRVRPTDAIDGAVWCSGRRLCWLTGSVVTGPGKATSEGAFFRYASGAIGAPMKVPGTVVVSGASCTTRTTCWATAIGRSRSHLWTLVRFNPVTGSSRAVALSGALGYPGPLSCIGDGLCTDIGFAGLARSEIRAAVTTLAHGRVTASAVVPGAQVLQSLSCPSAGQCVAVGVGGTLEAPDAVVVRLAGVREVDRIDRTDGSVFGSVVCRTTARCVAVGTSGRTAAIARVDGEAVTVKRSPGILWFTGVTCPRWGTCWAVGQSSFTKKLTSSLVLAPFTP